MSLSPSSVYAIAVRLAALALFLLFTPLLYGQTGDPLVIASEGARPPFNFIDADNQLAGFEIDLARELCRRMNRTCSFTAQDWDGLIPGLIAHQFDAVMAALDLTEERRGKIAFSTPYVRMPASFAVQKDSGLKDASLATLNRRTVGVEEQSASQNLIEERYPGVSAKAYGSLEEAMLDLGAGKVDAVLADKLALSAFLKERREGKCCRILADAPRDPAVFGEGIGIGLRKDDAALREAFDAALQGAVDDGTFARIAGKYFDFPIR